MTKLFLPGWHKDHTDIRDFNAMQLVGIPAPLPKKFIVDSSAIVLDQGNQPACVGFSGAGAKTDQELWQYGHRYKFDGLDLYRRCKKIDGHPYEDGTEPRFMLKLLNKEGLKRSGWFYRVDFRYHIDAYYRINPGTPDEAIKQIIYKFGTIIVGSNWYESWMDKFSVFPRPDYVAGGHAYRIIGWTELGYIVANSWGKKLWGINGIAIMPYNIFRSVLAEGDCWKLVDFTNKKAKRGKIACKGVIMFDTPNAFQFA